MNYFGALYDTSPDRAYLVLQKPSEAEYPVSVFPEYANRSLQSLLWELKEVVPENEREEVARAYEVSRNFSTLYSSSKPLRVSSNTKTGKVLSAIQNMAVQKLVPKYLLSNLNLERWGKPLEDLFDNE